MTNMEDIMQICPKCGKIATIDGYPCNICKTIMVNMDIDFYEYNDLGEDGREEWRQEIREKFHLNSPQYSEAATKKRIADEEYWDREVDRIQSLPDEEDTVQCPNCSSTQITAQKKGFGAGKAVAGAVLFGGVGLLGGFFGSKKVLLTCLNCGKQWKPGDN